MSAGGAVIVTTCNINQSLQGVKSEGLLAKPDSMDIPVGIKVLTNGRCKLNN